MSQSASAKQVWTVGELLQWTEKFFAQKGLESPRLDAQVLLAHVLGCDRIHIYTRFDESTADDRRTQFRDLVRRRVEGCPVAYLVGRKEFYQLAFEVTPAVLIPRPATEAVVLAALERAKPLSAPRILDVGTGSGCIAISIAKQHLGAQIIATDVSEEALVVARRNAETLGTSSRLSVVRSDLFAELARDDAFDLIVSNPPYVRSGDIAQLSADIRDHEPRLALDGGADGFAVIDRLLAEAPSRLRPGGWLVIEIGADQPDEMLARLNTISDLVDGQILPDRDGHARVAVARRRD